MLDEAAVEDDEHDRARKLAIPTQDASGPTAATTIPQPMSEPARPIATVSHAASGPGPGTAKRASAPVTKAERSRAMMLPSIGGG